jgi:hypothetical protein
VAFRHGGADGAVVQVSGFGRVGIQMLTVSASSFETHKKILQVRGPSGSEVILIRYNGLIAYHLVPEKLPIADRGAGARKD